jgi:hypothetical protein
MKSFCSRCARDLEIHQFYKSLLTKSGFFYICKNCLREEREKNKVSQEEIVMNKIKVKNIPPAKDMSYVERLAFQIVQGEKTFDDLKGEFKHVYYGGATVQKVLEVLAKWKS